MIKLIASDIDGTLIPYGKSQLPDELFPLIRRLRRAGVLFCPASGRQYHSLRVLFAPVADEICYLCENGAAVFGPGTEADAPLLSKTPMPRPDALALARAILAAPGCDVLISGERTGYLCRCGERILRDMRERVKNMIQIVENVEDITEDMIKVSAFCPGGPEAPAELLGPRFGAAFHMAAAGPDWLDFTLADKGTGLRGLCAALEIDPGDVCAFGDNWNDVPMLEAAGTAVLMDTAAPGLRERFPRQCRSVPEELKSILTQAERPARERGGAV